MIIVGIDPGIGGGVAIVETNGTTLDIVEGFRMPVTKQKTRSIVDSHALYDRLVAHPVAQVVIERAVSMPGQGHVGAFSYGRAFGAAEAVAASRCLRVEYVTPAVWKKALGLNKDKRVAMAAATGAFGTDKYWPLRADDGVAEAALLTHWWYNKPRSSIGKDD